MILVYLLEEPDLDDTIYCERNSIKSFMNISDSRTILL